MATGGGGAVRLAVDASLFEAQMTRAINQFTRYSSGIRAASFASTTFNAAGRLTDGVIRAITDSGGQMEVAIRRAGRGWQILNQQVRQASAAQTLAAQQMEQAAAREARVAARRTAQVAAFRKEAAILQRAGTAALPNPRSLLPAGVNPVRTRLFQGALQDLEDFVRRGRISAQRAIAIIDEVNRGVNRRQKNPNHEEYRLTAMRLIQSARNIRREVDRDNMRTQNRAASVNVQPQLQATLGNLPTTALAGATSRMEGYYNKIARIIETTTGSAGVSFARFQQLLNGFAAGTVAPTNAAERQVVKTMRSITQELARETARQATIAAKAQAQRDSTRVGRDIRNTLGGLPATAPAGAQARVNGYYDSIAKTVQSATATTGVNLARFQQLLTDFAAGVVAPANAAERQVVRSFSRIRSETQREVDRQTRITQRQQAAADSRRIAPALQAQFGQLQPGASPASASRLEGYYNRISRAIESSTNAAGVNLPRFQQLVADFATGVANPINNAERQVVKGFRNIQAEMERDQARVARLQAQGARNLGATNAGQTLYNRLGAHNLARLTEQDLERVQQQVARIQRLISRANNPLSSAGFVAATNAGLTGGGRGQFQGVEEEARRAASRIRAIMTGQLQTPFEVHIQAAQRDFQLLRQGLTLIFTGQAIQNLAQGFENLVSAAAEYQRSIALIQTITQDANVSFQQWSNSIEKVSNNLGKPIEEVAKATYDLLSNQVTQGLGDSMAVMNTAAQFARTTNSGIEDSVNLLSSAINTFKLSSGDAERVAASFFTTIDLGRVRTGEMANTIGRSAVYAQTLGVTLQELQAGIITITQTGQKADSSFTLLNNVFQKLLNPTKELQAYYDELGVGTGELFVKTYGFTGALQKLQEATGGSTAKLSDFFNEIRAFGGIDALISRSRQFKNALEELGDSATKANIAKMKFDELPGQRFLQEMTKFRNAFLTGFQTKILKWTLNLTDWFGGLSRSLIFLSQAIASLGTAIAVAFIANRVIGYYNALRTTAAVTTSLMGITVNYGIAANLAFGSVILLTAALAAALIKLSEAQEKYAEQVAEMSEEVAAKQKATAAAKYSDLRAQYAKDLAVERQSLLARVADYVKIAQKRVEIEAKASKAIQESTKNAYENALSSAKNSLEVLKNKQQDALKYINDFGQTGPNRIKNNRDESLFRYRLQRNDSVNNGDVRVERRLYQDRIRQLNDLARNAAKAGDHETATKFLDQKDQLINELSTKTVQAGGQTYMKYTQVEQMLRESANYRLSVEQQITEVLKKRVLDQQQAIQEQMDALKGLEDAYKDVYDMDTTKDGKPIYKNKEEFNKEYDRRVEEAKKKTAAYQERFGAKDPTMSQDLTRRQFGIATGRAAAYRDAAGRHFDAETGLQQGQNIQQDTIRSNEEADERHKLLTKRAEEIDQNMINQKKRFTDSFLPHANQNTIPGEPMFGKVDPNNAWHQHYYNAPKTENGPAILKKAELIKDIQDLQQAGNYELAEKKIVELMELYRKAGLLKRQMIGENGQTTTIEENLNAARQAVRQMGVLAQEKKGAEAALKQPQEAQTYAAKALRELETQFGKVGDASSVTAKVIAGNFQKEGEMADALAEKLRRIIEMQREIGPTPDEVDKADYQRKHEYDSRPSAVTPALGGSIGYYGRGGGPKGTDIIPAWLSPGEYVVRASEAQKHAGLLNALNSGFYDKRAEYHADGGDAGLYGGGIFGTVSSHNKNWEKRMRERAEKIEKFNEVMKALEEQGVNAQTRAQMAADFYHPQAKQKRQRLHAHRMKKDRGTGVENPDWMGIGGDEDDYEYHNVGGWVGQQRMPGRLTAMNSGFGVTNSESHNDSSVNVGDINVTVNGGNSGKQTAETIGRELNRAIRRKSVQLRGN